MTPDLLWDCACGTGEGPLWSAAEQALWFVDIPGCRLLRYTLADDRREEWRTPSKPGFVALAAGGGLVVGLAHALARFDPGKDTFTPFCDVETDRPTNRINDGVVGPDGHLWFGTMDDAEVAQSGALYSWDAAQGLVRHDDGYGVTNGPCFSPDARTFYLTDSFARTVFAYDYHDGRLSNRRVFIELEDGAGFPDGTTVDAEGGLWIGLWEGWAARRYAPDGTRTHEVRLPVGNVTKIGFGGPDRRTAYVTTAHGGLTGTALAAQPLAGALFAFEAAVPGLPPHAIALG